ncbi:hypothetical protein F751_7011 [Auxenochlorella protothecoides]|uniref:DUF3700 domain-containing protein n=2 Tax=Auxenochlorella protothecoides TaxID=3075 RepID=A0A087SR90_AUXPR|nr:hypothetical protein F751_7011 [Auxenochlorella protothecoides]KFM28244.1 hypothetical protein F751_7011 [Auxenochlorella protothecoides]RMZ56424.1 hypothetical protein APUTEX25_004647 [Auxenochlorella protothecoides]|eukprot:RMZ56424.1 hypothetical protein APUTEX25_004647 [Auxenochlorella protothecoides]
MPDEPLESGWFYATVPRSGGLPAFLSFGRGSLEKTTQSRIGTLLRSAPAPPPVHALRGQTFNPSPEVYRFGAGTAIVVCQSPSPGSGPGPAYQEPALASDPTGLCILAPGSYISNLEELAERYEDAPAPRGAPQDPRAAAAALVLRLYARDPDPLLVLSELQGEYAFLLYDAERRTAFAARDASGALPLHYEIDADGGVSVASAPLPVPAEVGLTHWEVVPPGHFLAGRSPRLHQFALTQDQLAAREALEVSLEEECVSPRASRASLDWQSSQQLAF